MRLLTIIKTDASNVGNVGTKRAMNPSAGIAQKNSKNLAVVGGIFHWFDEGSPRRSLFETVTARLVIRTL